MSHPSLLADRLQRALRVGGDTLHTLSGADPIDDRDAVTTLLQIYDLHTGPLERVGPAVRFQHHPAVADLKLRLEDGFMGVLAESEDVDADIDVVPALRRLARFDLVPDIYTWIAEDATFDELVAFLALEGGPDGGFDDLVATCQVGLSGEPKVELARNYWDEMGRGDASRVHTLLHDQLVEAIAMPVIDRKQQPVEALERSALGGLLTTNRWLQPEMIGALGLIELQAGPRCRKVLAGLERVGAPAGAFPFYEEHAQVDPHHGRSWVNHAVVPLLETHPDWGQRIVRGAQWRSAVNARFFAAAARQSESRVA
jgi:hypothetical protein